MNNDIAGSEKGPLAVEEDLEEGSPSVRVRADAYENMLRQRHSPSPVKSFSPVKASGPKVCSKVSKSKTLSNKTGDGQQVNCSSESTSGCSNDLLPHIASSSEGKISVASSSDSCISVKIAESKSSNVRETRSRSRSRGRLASNNQVRT